MATAVWVPFNDVCTAPGLSVTLYSQEGDSGAQVPTYSCNAVSHLCTFHLYMYVNSYLYVHMCTRDPMPS